MIQYNTLKVKLSNSELNKLKSGIKKWFWSNFENFLNDEKNFPHKLLLTNTQVLRLYKGFPNNFSDNIKLSKIQLHKIGQSGRFLGKLSGHY